MFRFNDPTLRNKQQLEQQPRWNKIQMESGEQLKEISDVDSKHSITDTDGEDVGSDHENEKYYQVAKEFRSK